MVATASSVPSLRIGQTCDVTIEAAAGAGQYKSRIEDIDGATVRIAMPTQQGQLVAPPMGQAIQLTVQAAGGGTLFIQAEVTGRQNQPFPTLSARIVSASQQQARSYYRAGVTIWPSECSVWGEVPHDEAAESGTNEPATQLPFWRHVHAALHDLSGGGAALLTHERLHEGDRVKLRFPLPHGGGELAVSGEIRRSISRGPDAEGQPRWDVGVAFEGMKAEARDALVKAVNRVQAEERRRQAA